MSYFELQDAKEFLDVIHAADDAKLQRLLDGAESEALGYLDAESFDALVAVDSDSSSSEQELPSVIETAVYFLLQSVYQASPEQREKLREAAEVMLFPYRNTLGV